MGAPADCGDGALGGSEQCDDGNAVDGDGCSAACVVELSEDCPGTAVALSPSGVLLANDLTGAADDQDPGCGSDGQPDVVYAVTPSASGTLTATLAAADGSVSIRSSCPSPLDIAVTELACGLAAAPPVWVHAGVTYYVIVDGDGAFQLDLRLTACGDGVVEGLEQCDDAGNQSCIGCVLCDGTGEFWDAKNTRCYWLEQTTHLSWLQARAACVEWGGDLAAPSTNAEYDFLQTHQSPWLTESTWIGGYATEPICSYAFSNGEPWRSDWGTDEPNNYNNNEQCVEMYAPSLFKMNDQNCATQNHFFCERVPAGECGDGILQPGEMCDDGGTTGNGCNAQCQRGFACAAEEFSDTMTNHCYRLFADPKNWFAAKADCEVLGGYLASIESETEMNLVRDNTPNPTWIGAYEGGFNDGTVTWETSQLTCSGYKNWNGGQPNDNSQDCVRIRDDGRWEDSSCYEANAYICEREP